MRTDTITVYTFDELSDRAKAAARDWWRSCQDASDFEYTIEDADRMAAILGIDIDRHSVPLMGGGTRQDPSIWWSLGYMQSDGAWIEARYSYAKGAHKAIRKEAPEDTTLHAIADRLLALQRRYRYQLTARVKDSSRGSMDLDIEHPTRAIDVDTYKTFREIVKDFQSWIYDQLRKEDEYRSADEQVDEAIRANEYEFTADGDRYL